MFSLKVKLSFKEFEYQPVDIDIDKRSRFEKNIGKLIAGYLASRGH